MPHISLQAFLAGATRKAAADLETALQALPEEKWNWSAGGEARTAINMVAECALVNSGFAQVIAARAWPDGYDLSRFDQDVADLAADPQEALRRLRDGSDKLASAIEKVATDDLDTEVQMAWGPMALSHMIAHGYWNMSYHEGQINYIRALLG